MNRASRYLANVRFLTFVRVVVFVCICHHATESDGKVFERCELAQLLRYGHGLDVIDVANWVCIAQHSSSLNTSAFGGNARSGSHGLFQISDQYWCSPPGKGVACGMTCDRLRDDNIGDDLACVQMIYQEHQRLSGDGYNAWNAYEQYCRENPYEYVEDCFGNEEREYLHSKSITANYVEDEEEEYDPYSKKKGKVYGRCELAKELFLKHKMPMEEIPTWVCIAQHESNYDTSAVGRLNTDGSADHGLFQISDLYWCSQKGGRRKACGLPCSKFLDSDISDDVKCVKQIYKEHTRISGDGFTAWTVYNAYCHGRTASYIRGCFDGIDGVESSISEEYKKPPKPSKAARQKEHGKVYEPCELAEELRSKHHIPEEQIATWVCIAKHESGYNTSAIGYGDHGLFQISDIYWCSPPGKGWACGLSCADLEDSDISDDVKCIRKIYDEHTHLSGDGFNAWTVYPRHCSEGRSDSYISHCSGKRPTPAVTAPPHGYAKLINPNSIEEYQPNGKGKIYGRCELAKELLTKHKMSMDEIPTWVCIAHHESNFDTSAVGRLNIDGSADHGLFQISDLYWCSHKDGHRKACGLPCSKLLDNDITDDVRCIKQIHNEHTKISGDGFSAWTVYDAYCRDQTEQYIRGCFDGSASVEDFKPVLKSRDIGYLPKNKPKGKIYEECELAKELRDKYHMPRDQISSWVCIAKHQSELNTSSSISNVHGLFHISDEYWCSPPGKGKVCELNCADLEDSDISDDLECVQKIYQEHERLFGNGFSAWIVYPQHCSDGRSDDYVGHCPGFESPTTNAIPYGKQQYVHPKATNKPVYNHVFSENPFLRHFDTISQVFPDPIEESFSASEEVESVVPANHEFSLNPFLKLIKTGEQTIKTTTSPQSSFFSVPIAPTPTWSNRVQTYQPKNEEKAKNEAFKSFATPSLSVSTQTPRANRLQTYQLNTFRTFATPSLPVPTTHAPATNRLQPYQLNTFNSVKTIATPTTRSLSASISTAKTLVLPSLPPLPTLRPKSSTKPFTQVTSTTKTPLTSVTKASGRYDAGRYDSGRYDSGKYNPSQSQTASKTATTKTETKPSVISSGQYPVAKPTVTSKAPTTIRITPTSLSTSKAIVTSTQKTEQQQNTKIPLNSGHYVPYKAPATSTLTTKSPSTAKIVSTTTSSIKFDSFKTFATTTLKPTITTTKKLESSKVVNLGHYIPYKPSSTGKDSGHYNPNKYVATPSLPTKSNSGIKTTTTTSPTKKYDPFKPFITSSGAYDPFKAFNTGKQQSSSFSFLSGKATSSNEIDFVHSSNSKRETATSRNHSSTGDLKNSSTIKRETNASTQSEPSSSKSKESAQTITSSEEKPLIPTTTYTKPKVETPSSVKITSSSASSTTASKSATSNRSVPTKSATPHSVITKPVGASNTSKGTAAKSTSATTTKSVTISSRKTAASKAGSIVTSKPTLGAYRQYTATPTTPIAASTRLPATPSSTRSSSISKSAVSPGVSKPTTNAPPTRSAITTRSLTPSSLTRTTIKTTATVTSSLVPTRIESLTPSKVSSTSRRSTRSITNKKPSTNVISPTKSRSSSESLFSTRFNIYDLYYKLYGVHPPTKTSSGVQQVIKTSQTNVVPSRLS